jgi:membrane protein
MVSQKGELLLDAYFALGSRAAQIIKRAFLEWLRDDASLLAAALAYYGLFSFVPLFIIVLIFINSFILQGFLSGEMAQKAHDLAGSQAPPLASEMIDRAWDQASSFSFTLLSAGILLLAAAGLFVQTKRALRLIWRLPEKKIPLLDMILSYLRSFLLIAIVAFLLLATTVFTAVLLPLGQRIEELLPLHLGLLRLVTFFISLAFVTLLFAIIYRTLIDVKLEWRQVLPGSLLAALLVGLGNILIEIYVEFADIGSAYGAAGSLVIFLFWIYYAAQIFLFGAELIKVQTREEMRKETDLD